MHTTLGTGQPHDAKLERAEARLQKVKVQVQQETRAVAQRKAVLRRKEQATKKRRAFIAGVAFLDYCAKLRSQGRALDVAKAMATIAPFVNDPRDRRILGVPPHPSQQENLK